MQLQPKTILTDKEEVNEFLTKLISGKIEANNELEGEYVNQLRQITSSMIQMQSRLQSLQSEMEQIKNSLQRSIGQKETLANVLVTMERVRREKDLHDGTKKGESGK